MLKPLYSITWEEAKDYFEKTNVALIPTGSVEQHGPHMPLGTDFQIADTLAKRISEKTDVILTPVIPVGFAKYHTDFPGTLSVETDVLVQYYLGIVNSLIKHGITHFLFINGHGGNGTALTSVCKNLRERGYTSAYFQWWDVAGGINKDWSMRGHGDIVETSMMMYLTPDDVKIEKASIPTNKSLTDKVDILDGSACKFKEGAVRFYLNSADTTDTGDLMEFGHASGADYSTSPADSTAKNGEDIINAVVDYVVDFIEEFKKINFK